MPSLTSKCKYLTLKTLASKSSLPGIANVLESLPELEKLYIKNASSAPSSNSANELDEILMDMMSSHSLKVRFTSPLIVILSLVGLAIFIVMISRSRLMLSHLNMH